MKRIILTLIALVFFLWGCDGCFDSSLKNRRESQKEETAAFKNIAEYYQSFFTINGVKDLENRVFTGLTIKEKLGEARDYQLPSGKYAKVFYFPKGNPQLFKIETTLIHIGMEFELYQNREILRISELDRILFVHLASEGLFHIFELENKILNSVSYAFGKYHGTLNNRDFAEDDEATQKAAEEFCRQFMETKYKTLKKEMEVDDIYRIYRKALKKCSPR